MKKIITLILLCLPVGLIAQSSYVSPKKITFTARWISQEYEVVRIGEHEWVNKNFHHNYTDAWFPNLGDWWMQVDYSNAQQLAKSHDNYYLKPASNSPYNPSTIVIGSKKPGKAESEYLLPDGKPENIKAKSFDYWFGAYYFGSRKADGLLYPGNGQNSGNTIDYMHVINKIASGSPCPTTTNWELPTNNDIRQLLAMCSFDTNNGRLDAIAARIALGARRGENPFAYDIPDPTNKGYKTYWFETSNNELGFNLMPAGQKYNAQEYVAAMESGYKAFTAYTGDFQQLHYTASFQTQDGGFTLHDYLTFYEQMGSNRRYTVRWCRALTPEELGYNIWVLKDRSGNITNIQKTVATKQWGTPPKPAGGSWTELEHGYLRGFYIKYMMDKPNSSYTLTNIKKMYADVDEETIGQGYYFPAPTQTKGKSVKSIQPQTLNPFAEENNQITIYPNPVDNILTIQFEKPEIIKSIAIYNINNGNLAIKAGLNGSNQTDVSKLSSGIYSVVIETSKGKQYTTKMIKR